MKTYTLGSLTGMMAMSNLLSQTPDDKAAMNLAFTLHLHGELDIPKLERAIGKLLAEPIMNTYLSAEGMEITAHEKEFVPFSLPIEQAEGTSVEEKVEYVKAAAEKRALEPLPLTDADARQSVFCLYEIAADYHILLMIVHHTFLDFGAVMIAISHIFAAYNDENYKYPDCRPFSDFMKEELDFMASDHAKAEDEYWAAETADIRQPSLVPDVFEEGESILTEQDVMTAFSRSELDAIASKERTSTFNLMMLLIHMGIAKVNDCNDTILQYAISNRSEKDYRFTLGCMTRVLFNRMDFDDNMNGTELNKLLRKKIGAGYQNRHVAGKTPFGAVSYLAVNEDMADLNSFPMFNGKPVPFDFVDMPRELDFVAVLIMPLGEDMIGAGVLTDMKRYSKHAKKLIDAIKLAKEFIVKYPQRTFSDFMRQDITRETLQLLDDPDSVEIIEL